MTICDVLSWSFDAITSANWLEFLKTIAAVATPFVGFLALQNWRRQDKAKRAAEFLDALIEAVHEYVAEMPKPVMLSEIAKIGMASHVPTWEDGDDAAKTVKGAIAYIQKNGEHDAKRLFDMLKSVEPSAIKLRALAAKGQVFKFDGYSRCWNAVAMLTWQFDRMQALALVIGSSTWNWENSEVLRHLQDVMAIDPDDIRKSLQNNNTAILEFVRNTYERIYG